MARATRWTDEKVKALKLPTGKASQRVLVEPGLYLLMRQRVDGECSKQWEFRAQVAGVRRWLSLGSYPAVSLARAYADLVTQRAAQVAAKKGEADHPAQAARFARKAARAQPTVIETFEEWIADKRLGSARKQGRPVRERTIQILKDNFDLDIRAKVGSAKIDKIGREALQSCIDAPRKRGAPGAAAHVYRTLKGLINFAVARSYISGADPMRGIANPKPYRPAPVNSASDSEIASLLKAVDGSRMWPTTKLAIEFELLTGARPSEVRLANWCEIDLAKQVWNIPAAKVKSDRSFKVHLSSQAVDVLKRALCYRDGDGSQTLESELVFKGAKGRAMEKRAVGRALTRLAEQGHVDGKRLAPHDLRRTFRTLLSRLKIQPHVAELCINHQEPETMRRVYDGHDYWEETVDAWDRAGARIQALRGPTARAKTPRARKPANRCASEDSLVHGEARATYGASA